MTGTMQTVNRISELEKPHLNGARDAVQIEEGDPGDESVSIVAVGGIRLNLGCDDKTIDGWVNIDRKTGTEAYPLPQYADNSVDEIRASHILEHFSYRDTLKVLKEWHRVLKPGGRIRIAVPDLDVITRKYEEGSDPNIECYMFGGHYDNNDVHLAWFNETKIREALKSVGFVKHFRWESELDDCARMDVSLNWGGIKVDPASMRMSTTTAICSLPRLCFTGHAFCLAKTIYNTGCAVRIAGGAYWHHGMDKLFAEVVADGSEYILCLDYDTVFESDDVIRMHDIMRRRPDIDALAPLQMRRGVDAPLAGFLNTGGEPGKEVEIDRAFFDAETIPLKTAHFGLTLIRTSALVRMGRPWFMENPNSKGAWEDAKKSDDGKSLDGKLDADIFFWHRFADRGLKLHLATKIPVGHLEEMVTWPNVHLKPTHGYWHDFHTGGAPAEVWR